MAWIAIGFWCFVLGSVLVRKYIGWPTNLTLLEYQRGVLYRKGLPVRNVNPGRVRVWVGIEKVIVVDTRPVPVSFENRAVSLADGSTAIYGFSGNAEVRDARQALDASQNYSQIPAYVLLCCTRLVLNGYAKNQVQIGQRAIEEEVVKRAKPRLAAQGFDLLSFRMTQLSIATPPPQPTGTFGAESTS
jgi:hypothetical protein